MHCLSILTEAMKFSFETGVLRSPLPGYEIHLFVTGGVVHFIQIRTSEWSLSLMLLSNNSLAEAQENQFDPNTSGGG